DREVGLADVPCAVVGRRVHGDRGDAEPPQRAGDTDRDLAAVGDEDAAERGGPGHRAHIRNSPSRGSGSGVRETTSSASPSTVRVSAGSMMPSSHSRAVAWYGLPSAS